VKQRTSSNVRTSAMAGSCPVAWRPAPRKAATFASGRASARVPTALAADVRARLSQLDCSMAARLPSAALYSQLSMPGEPGPLEYVLKPK